MKTIQKSLLGIFGVLCLLSAQNSKAQTYYAVATASERTNGDNGTEHRLIVSYVFPVKFCKDQTVSLYDAKRETSEATRAIETQFEEQYNYALGRKDYWIGNKRFVRIYMYETSNEATSQMKQIISKYNSKKSDGQGDIGMMDMQLECIK